MGKKPKPKHMMVKCPDCGKTAIISVKTRQYSCGGCRLRVQVPRPPKDTPILDAGAIPPQAQGVPTLEAGFVDPEPEAPADPGAALARLPNLSPAELGKLDPAEAMAAIRAATPAQLAQITQGLGGLDQAAMASLAGDWSKDIKDIMGIDGKALARSFRALAAIVEEGEVRAALIGCAEACEVMDGHFSTLPIDVQRRFFEHFMEHEMFGPKKTKSLL